MELYQLKTFKMVAEIGHLTKASKRLYTSQPAVSSHIRSLEEELGVQLFVRSQKGMELTGHGVELKAYADKILAMTDEMASRAKLMQSEISGNLRLGLNSESEILKVAELYRRLAGHNPGLKISFLQSSSGEVLNNLEDDRIDAGFIYGVNESEKIETLSLFHFDVVVAGAESLSPSFCTCTPKELETYPWITTPADCPFHTVLKELFERHALKPQEVLLADQERTINAMVKNGAGLALVLECDTKQAGFSIWQGEKLTLPLSIAFLKRRRDDPIIQQLLTILQEIWDIDRLSEVCSC